MEDNVKDKIQLKENPSTVLWKNSGMQEGTSTKRIKIMSYL